MVPLIRGRGKRVWCVGILVRNKKRVKELAVSPRKKGRGRMKMEKPRLRTEDPRILGGSFDKHCGTFWCTAPNYLLIFGTTCASKDRQLGRDDITCGLESPWKNSTTTLHAGLRKQPYMLRIVVIDCDLVLRMRSWRSVLVVSLRLYSSQQP